MLVGAISLHGQPSPIVTDRPAITNASVGVPTGTLQVENGIQVATAFGRCVFDGPESLVVFGVTDSTELRLNVPDYNFASMTSGFGDLALGVKQQIGHTQSGFDASLIVSLSFPTGAQAISSHGYDPFRSAAHRTVGRICRICRRFSRAWRPAAPAALWNGV